MEGVLSILLQFAHLNTCETASQEILFEVFQHSISVVTYGKMCSEEKYAQLLQPIRAIAANFNINIAKELELYLVSRDVNYVKHT